jgi:hypothetical protein
VFARCVSVAGGIVLLATSCNDPLPEERFADRVCSMTVPFAEQMLEAYDDVVQTRASSGLASRATLEQHIFEGKHIVARFAARLRAVPAVESAAGAQATIHLEAHAAAALDRVSREERRVRRLPEEITRAESAHSLEQIEVTLFNAFAEMISAPALTAEFVPQFKAAFEGADSCKELEAMGQD